VTWRCEVFDDLIVRHWENEVFLFNPHTGDTHILNDIAWRLLVACSSARQSQGALLEQLAVDLGGADREELADLLSDHIDQLIQLGLVEQYKDHDAC
jgi:PqqD family protein of HPr-rel-A system